VVAESATWPRCGACGQACGSFDPGEKSPIRSMLEQVAERRA
jgi:hypothetical protein